MSSNIYLKKKKTSNLEGLPVDNPKILMCFVISLKLCIYDHSVKGETECPVGCCPEPGWFCCTDNIHCAAVQG